MLPLYVLAAQVKYGALDAFVSYAAGVKVLQGAKPLPPAVDLTLPKHWEVTLVAQWVATNQFQEAGKSPRTKHDFYHAKFEVEKVGDRLRSVMPGEFQEARVNEWQLAGCRIR